ncbi:hypothetical protein JQX13_27450 [Archangium violaceum]|uniref:hypothetical protein n=1 Tax=Archangium violaceum TaxID=83451 RepID=UPI00193BFD76|nr:hypothetical protein [Archangium violaceum]QRK04017.1 hypothetical protein JQX13_27450 [Archangium violaceum]
MNARLLAAFLCLASLGSGCIIVDHDDDHDDGPCCNTNPPPPPAARPGDVTFLWTFAPDFRCSDVPEVKNIHISIPGETLYNGGVYACSTAGVDGIVLHDFVPGNYSFTIKAYSYTNETLYEGRGTFTVNGDVRVNIDLTPNGMSYAYVSWSFPPNTYSQNPSCSQANVTSVKASIDGGEWVTLNCADGMTNGGVETPWLEDGTHTIDLVAYGRDRAGRDGMPLYSTQGTFVTSAGSPRSESFRFYEVGGMSLRWELWDGYDFVNCAEAGLTGMSINLFDKATGKFVYGTVGDPQPCTGAPVLYQFLKPGSYDVYIRGMKGSTILYTNEDAPTTVTVWAFDQKTAADPSTEITLIRY